MRERLRHHVAHAFFLQTVITDGAGGTQCLLDIALLEHLATAVGMIAPQPGKTVGLQFQLYGQCIRLGLADAALRLPDLVADTQQVLHVMADLVGNDVGLGEVTGRPVPLFEVLEEGEVDVDLVIGRAVERSHRGCCHAAGGLYGAGEHHQHWFPVVETAGPEYGVPGVLRIRQHHRDEVREPFLFRRRTVLVSCRDRCSTLLHLQQHLRIDAEEIGQRQGDNNGADAALEGAPAQSPAAAVLDVGTSPSCSPAHDRHC